jgi:hypothetical protein
MRLTRKLHPKFTFVTAERILLIFSTYARDAGFSLFSPAPPEKFWNRLPLLPGLSTVFIITVPHVNVVVDMSVVILSRKNDIVWAVAVQCCMHSVGSHCCRWSQFACVARVFHCDHQHVFNRSLSELCAVLRNSSYIGRSLSTLINCSANNSSS